VKIRGYKEEGHGRGGTGEWGGRLAGGGRKCTGGGGGMRLPWVEMDWGGSGGGCRKLGINKGGKKRGGAGEKVARE